MNRTQVWDGRGHFFAAAAEVVKLCFFIGLTQEQAAAPEGAAEALRACGFTVAVFPHSLNATLPGSRLRIQITIKSRYGNFPSRAVDGYFARIAGSASASETVR